MADQARQYGAGAHVGARQADAGEQEGGLGVGRGEADVAGHGEDRARPGAHAVDRGDDRLRAGAHRADQIAGHAGELDQPAIVHPGQRADDVVDVAAGAEIAPRAGDDDAFDLRRMAKLEKQVAKLGIAFEGQRILALGPVQA